MEDHAELEAFAAELAHAAGEEIVAGMRRAVDFEYKEPRKPGLRPTPVSAIDVAIEREARERIAERFPSHCVLGEELGGDFDDDEGYVWAIDPIDGTTNFLHRFPAIASSFACLHRRQPIAGAVWCSSSHELRRGVYHARRGGALCFEGEPLSERGLKQAIGRKLVGAPGAMPEGRHWDQRTTGSAAFECALVAAGVLRAARLARLDVWDVAGGVALLEAAGRRVLVEDRGSWQSFEDFGPELRAWHQGLLIGEPLAVAELSEESGFAP